MVSHSLVASLIFEWRRSDENKRLRLPSIVSAAHCVPGMEQAIDEDEERSMTVLKLGIDGHGKKRKMNLRLVTE